MTHIPKVPCRAHWLIQILAHFLPSTCPPFEAGGYIRIARARNFHARYRRAAREIIVVAACADVGGLTFFSAVLRVGVVFFHSLRLFPSDCCHCVHVSCRGKQTTLFILLSPVFQTGSPSLFVESLICRGASPSAPVDSSTAACSVPRSRLSSRRSWVRPARHSTLGEAGRDLQVFVVSVSMRSDCLPVMDNIEFVHLGHRS